MSEQEQREERTGNSNRDILDQLGTLLDTKMQAFKAELLESSEAASASQIEELRRLRAAVKPTFKKKANEEQYEHALAVQEKIDLTEEAIDKRRLDTAKRHLAEGRDLLKQRQKLIMIADSSEFGWRTAVEYKTNPLAEDSDDERRLWKSEQRAGKKVKDAKAKKRRPTFRAQEQDVPQAGLAKKVRTGTCYGCGKPGHYRFECRAPNPGYMGSSSGAGAGSSA